MTSATPGKYYINIDTIWFVLFYFCFAASPCHFFLLPSFLLPSPPLESQIVVYRECRSNWTAVPSQARTLGGWLLNPSQPTQQISIFSLSVHSVLTSLSAISLVPDIYLHLPFYFGFTKHSHLPLASPLINFWIEGGGCWHIQGWYEVWPLAALLPVYHLELFFFSECTSFI